MKVEILIVSYHKDFQWLDYCLASIRRFANGFNGVTLAIPSNGPDYKIDEWPLEFPITLHRYEEISGKGMVQHEERICSADLICRDADYVLHLDSDCVFNCNVTPEYYFDGNGRPLYVWRPYNTMPLCPGAFPAYKFWTPCVREALGWEPEAYGMCRHPHVYPVSLYPAVRQRIEEVNAVPFRDYVLSKKNDFPTGFAEFPTLGEFAFQRMRERFHWIDMTSEVPPDSRVTSFWSHGGLDRPIDNDGRTPRKIIDQIFSQ